MGFSWNGVHTGSVGILAEVQSLPVLPEPKIITDEVPGKDGFYDFSRYNAENTVKYKPRIWVYRCSFENKGKSDKMTRINAVIDIFGKYDGILIDDNFPDLRWSGIIINKIDLTQVAKTFHTFPVTFQTQPFPENM